MILSRHSLVIAMLAVNAGHAFCQTAVDFRAAATKALPATVAVESDKTDKQPENWQDLGDQLQSRFWAPRPGNRSTMFFRNDMRFQFMAFSASGFAIAPDLVIVATTGSIDDVVKVRASGKSEHQGKIVANDYVAGLSAVRLDNPSLEPLTVSERPLEPGQPVLMTEVSETGDALAHSGMIASLATSSNPEYGMVHQLDVASRHLSSGSPVVDDKGELVGVAIVTQSGTVCVPSSSVKRLAEIAQSETPADLYAGRLGIALDGSGKTLVTEVMNDSPAKKAGFQQGDRIVSVGGQPTKTGADVVAAIGMHRGGDTVQVVIQRDDAETEFSIVLDSDKSPRASVPSAFPSQMWRMENGKLVPMDKNRGADAQEGYGEVIPSITNPGMSDSIVVSPPELRGIIVERSKMDEKMNDVQQQLEETKKHQQELEQKLRRLRTAPIESVDESRSEKLDVNKLQQLLELLQEEVKSLKAERD